MLSQRKKRQPYLLFVSIQQKLFLLPLRNVRLIYFIIILHSLCNNDNLRHDVSVEIDSACMHTYKLRHVATNWT